MNIRHFPLSAGPRHGVSAPLLLDARSKLDARQDGRSHMVLTCGVPPGAVHAAKQIAASNDRDYRGKEKIRAFGGLDGMRPYPPIEAHEHVRSWSADTMERIEAADPSTA